MAVMFAGKIFVKQINYFHILEIKFYRNSE